MNYRNPLRLGKAPFAGSLGSLLVALLMVSAGWIAAALPVATDATGDEFDSLDWASGTAGPELPQEAPGREPLSTGVRGQDSQIPLFFEENLGQFPPAVKWGLEGPVSVWLHADSFAVMTPEGFAQATFVNGRGAGVSVIEQMAATKTVLDAKSGSEGLFGIRMATHLRMPQVWPGIDVDFYVNDAGLIEHDFIVAPGADTGNIRLSFAGGAPELLDGGALLAGSVRFDAPVAFQDGHDVAVSFELAGEFLSYNVGAFDSSKSLVIDPVLRYGSYLPNQLSTTGDMIYDMDYTSHGTYLLAGNQYGYYYGANTVPAGPNYGHSATPTNTLMGQPCYHYYVAYYKNMGITYPLYCVSYYQAFLAEFHRGTDQLQAFIVVGNLHYGYTYGMAADSDDRGHIYLGGYTQYAIPTTADATKDRSNFDYSYPISYPAKYPLASDYDAFVMEFANINTAPGGTPIYDLVFSTQHGGDYYLYENYPATGGKVSYNHDYLHDMVVAPNGTIWAGGYTYYGGHFPVVNAPWDIGSNYFYYDNWVARWGPDRTLEQSGRLPSDYYAYIREMEIDEEGSLYFVGMTYPRAGYARMQTTPGAIYPNPIGGTYDYFFGKIGPGGAVQYQSYFGTTSSEYTGYNMPTMAVIDKDLIAIGASSLFTTWPSGDYAIYSTSRGSYDAVVSIVDFSRDPAGNPVNRIPYSGYHGGSSVDYLTALEWEPMSQRLILAGFSASTNMDTNHGWADGVPLAPKQDPNGYDMFAMGIAPFQVDSSKASNAQSQMSKWGSFFGSGSTDYHYGGLGVYQNGNVVLGGSVYHQNAIPAMTTPNAISTTGYANNNYDLYVARLGTGPQINVRADASDGQSAETPLGAYIAMLPPTSVTLTANVVAVDWPVDTTKIEWDLDGDWSTIEGYGEEGPFLPGVKPGLINACARAFEKGESQAHFADCITLYWANRPPEAKLELAMDRHGHMESGHKFHRGETVWFIAADSYDYEGDLRIDETTWKFGGTGQQKGPTQALVTGFQYDTVGWKSASVTVRDGAGATGMASVKFQIHDMAPVAECVLLTNNPRVLAHIEIDVTGTTDVDGTIESWQLDPGQGPGAVLSGTGAPPAIVRTVDRTTISDEGDRVVTFSVTDNEGNVSTCELALTYGPPGLTADFAYGPEPINGISHGEIWAGHPVWFDENGLYPNGPVISWSWNFGDGKTATGQTPTHVFASPGTYEVGVTIHDASDLAKASKTVTVVAPPAGPDAVIKAPTAPHFAGEPLQFFDRSIPGEADIVSRSWKFGDVATSADVVTSQTLPAGLTVVTLEVVDSNGLKDTDVRNINAVPFRDPVPQFTASKVVVEVDEIVRFADTSVEGVYRTLGYEWDFGDRSTLESGPVVSHAFSYPGTYTVSMTLVDERERRHHAQNDIEVIDPNDVAGASGRTVLQDNLPVANAGPDRTVVEGTVVALDGRASSTATPQGLRYAWNQVGGSDVLLIDETTATPSLLVPYVASGEQVLVFELVVRDSLGASKPDLVRIFVHPSSGDAVGVLDAPAASFEASALSQGRFMFRAPTGAPETTYAWDFGDGTTGKGKELVHPFARPGVYEVTLTVTDTHGRVATFAQTITVGHDAGAATTNQVAIARSSMDEKTWAGLDAQAVILVAAALGALLLIGGFIIGKRR